MFTKYSRMRKRSNGSLIMNVKVIIPAFVLLFGSSFLCLKGKCFFPELFFSTASVYREEDGSAPGNSISRSISDPL